MEQYLHARIKITMQTRYYFLCLLHLFMNKYIHTRLRTRNVELFRNMIILGLLFIIINFRFQLFRYLPLIIAKYRLLLLAERRRLFRKCYCSFMGAMDYLRKYSMTMSHLLLLKKDGPLLMLISEEATKKDISGMLRLKAIRE